MSQRKEFIALAAQEAIPFAALCRRFGISRRTGYKWVDRVDLQDRSRRPLHSPNRTAPEVEKRVVELRQRHPAWGGRKLARVLRDRKLVVSLHPSTVSNILRRHGLLNSPPAGAGGRYTRFEHPYPNALWQMDFKGDFALQSLRCHPLTALDDHSRYAIVLQALQGQQASLVQSTLQRAFQRYGLPERMNMDNGQPWGSPNAEHGVSRLTVWLIRLGIRVSFSAPAHPQTNGKEERFHRSLKAEVLQGRVFHTLPDTQAAFDSWRHLYNHERPHEALQLDVPAKHYQPSTRPMPELLPPIEYASGDYVATVGWHGLVKFKSHEWKVSNALKDQPIAFRRRATDREQYDLYFCHHRLGMIDLAESSDV